MFDETEDLFLEIIEELKNSLNDPGSDLEKSFEVRKHVGATETTIEIIANEYWFYVDQGRGKTENGTKPGKVKEKIKKWIRKKNIGDGTITEDALAFLITRKIHREGFKGKDFVEPVLSSFEQRIETEILFDLGNILNELNSNATT